MDLCVDIGDHGLGEFARIRDWRDYGSETGSTHLLRPKERYLPENIRRALKDSERATPAEGSEFRWMLDAKEYCLDAGNGSVVTQVVRVTGVGPGVLLVYRYLSHGGGRTR
jgi:hypothetical protein